MKKCTCCGIDKLYSEFFKDRQKIDGLRSNCKSCCKINESIRVLDPEKLKKKKAAAIKSYHTRMSWDSKGLRNSQNEYRRSRYANDTEYREKVIKSASKNKQNRRDRDKSFKIMDGHRSRIGNFLKHKNDKYNHMLGCTAEFLKKHLESKFQPGMSWDNYGEWHIDHIFPLSIAYDLGPNKFEEACHYTNLQPLWAIDNIRKSNKIE